MHSTSKALTLSPCDLVGPHLNQVLFGRHGLLYRHWRDVPYVVRRAFGKACQYGTKHLLPQTFVKADVCSQQISEPPPE